MRTNSKNLAVLAGAAVALGATSGAANAEVMKGLLLPAIQKIPTGASDANPSPPHLIVSNIGASGDDGVELRHAFGPMEQVDLGIEFSGPVEFITWTTDSTDASGVHIEEAVLTCRKATASSVTIEYLVIMTFVQMGESVTLELVDTAGGGSVVHTGSFPGADGPVSFSIPMSAVTPITRGGGGVYNDVGTIHLSHTQDGASHTIIFSEVREMIPPGASAPVLADTITVHAPVQHPDLAQVALTATTSSGAAETGTVRLAGEICVPQGCPSDVNGDGATDSADLAELLGGWGACP
ncbi:MAG: hypothetical protein GF393_09350 [Armatimonadia bacterium]|nr:hypothetical protein [Armatimonadia bacterium]